MRSSPQRSGFCALLMLLFGIAVIGPAPAVEDGLMDVRIGASYREVDRRLGPPEGILLAAGGGMMYQTLPAPSAKAGLPQFGTQPAPAEVPVWVLPVRAGALAAGQAQWFYDLRSRKGVSLGIVLTGEGADAAVTDVIVAGFSKYLKGKPTPLHTERGIALQSSFADVLLKYGYPPLAEIYPAGGGAVGAGAGGAMRAGGGAARGGMRGGGARGGAARAGGMRGGGSARGGGGRGGRGGGRGMRGAAGSEAGPPAMAVASLSQVASYQVVLTGGRRGGGGGRGGGMRGGGGGGRRGGAGARGGGGGARRGGGGMRGGGGARAGGGRRGGGRGALPPLGAGAGAGAAAGGPVQAFSDTAPITFSRDCILTYEGIAFTIQDMKVMRIHVSE